MTTVGFIGLGLIGGSIAKSLKKADSTIYIMAYNRSPSSLEEALSDGGIDQALYEINDSFSRCDIIFLCTPVELNSQYLKIITPYIKQGCIITDVGSVKGYIHQTVSDLHLEHCFIGGHPMAGSEKTGYQASTDILLENAYFAITPTSATSDTALFFYISLVKKMGAIPIVVDPQEHDYAVAGISHLPHIIASSLVNMIRLNDTTDELMKMLAAGGFKDLTRIASSSPDMWAQICSTNKVQISQVLENYIESLTTMKNYIDSEEESSIHTLFEESKNYRDSIDIMTKGPVLRNHILYCDLEDKEGSLSTITLLLSTNHVNIKNIGIIHNREYEHGVLLIEFYDEPNTLKAYQLLTKNNYNIH